jgi:hypothetical protein
MSMTDGWNDDVAVARASLFRVEGHLSNQGLLPGLGSTQIDLFGLESPGRALDLARSVDIDPLGIGAGNPDNPDWEYKSKWSQWTAPWEDQLGLLADQPKLQDVPGIAVQLPLLPDPAPWETDPYPVLPPKPGRLARKRTRLGITPGQATLF